MVGKGIAGMPASSSLLLVINAIVGTTPNFAKISRDVRRQAHGCSFVDRIQALSSRFLAYFGTVAALLMSTTGIRLGAQERTRDPGLNPGV